MTTDRGPGRVWPVQRWTAVVVWLGILAGTAAAGEPSIRFSSPEDGSTVSVGEDMPVTIAFDVVGAALPLAGHVGIFFNGRDSGARLVKPPFSVSIADIDEGKWAVRAVLFDAGGHETGAEAVVNFMAKPFLELMVHDDFPIAAEHPRSGDPSMNDLPGIASWEDVPLGADGDETEYAGEDERLVRKRWARNLSPEDVTRGHDIFSKYGEFHRQVMSNRTLWDANSFLIFRIQDRGIGNQLEVLISAFAMAMLSNRVFLVDSTVMHHLLRPPPSIAWHYHPVPDQMDHDAILSEARMVDLRWQNPLEFPALLCDDLSQTYKERFLYLTADQYFLPVFIHNPKYAATLRTWLGEDYFGTLARFLLRPKTFILREAAAFYRENLEGRSSVGIQLRTATMKGHDMAGLVAGFDSFAWKRWVPAFWKCAYFASPKAAGTGYFIASDNHRAKTEADAFFGTNQSSWYSQEITRGHVRGHVTALIDVLVLSMCDHLVTTSMSTFGYIAAGLASLPPSIVNFDGSCLKDMTSQPCFHKWSYLFTAKCYDKHQMVSPEVRVCGFYRVPDASDDTF